jgi:PAS domain S-box-containing protein
MSNLHIKNNISLFAIIFGFAYWPLEALIHTYLFHEGTFLEMLLHAGADEIWMRTLVSSAFIGLGIYAHISSRKQEELIQKLQYQELRSRRIIETACDAYISIDKHSIITGWNPKSKAMFGWERNEVIGKLLTDVIIPERSRKGHLKGMSRYLQTSRGPWLYRPVQVKANTKHHGEINIEITITPLQEEGNLEFYTFIRKV